MPVSSLSPLCDTNISYPTYRDLTQEDIRCTCEASGLSLQDGVETAILER